MIHVSIIDDNIVGSYGDKPFSVPANLDLYNELVELADVANSAPSMETYIACLDTFESLVQVDYTKVVEHGANGLIHINPATKEFFLKHNDVVSTVPMPQALVDRIYDSIDKSINFMPLVKMWTRWLRNPILMKKGGTDFSNRFFNFVNMKYVHPKLKQELMEEFGLSEEVAEKRATMYQMKITQEGLLNGYKVSSEILHKYDTETGEEVPRYTRTFNPDCYSGEIHNIFVDPMHIGAVPDDVDGAIRCKQYFVHSSLSGVNGSIYHSSTYAAKTDEEWAEMRAESIATWSKEAKEIVGKATAIID